MLIDQQKLFFGAGLIVFILITVGGYGYFKMRSLIMGPTINIEGPQNWAALGTSTETISGKAQNVSLLYLNDRPISIDEYGNFSEVVALSPGYNIISIKGADKFGKQTEKVLQLVLKE